MSASRLQRRACAAGFTLIELMVTLTIAAILLLLATPSFVAFQRNSQLTSAANSLVGALSVARGEAMKRGTSVVVIPASGSDWSTGATVFIDGNNDQALNTGEQVLLQQPALPSFIGATGQSSVLTSLTYVMFDGSGFSRTGTAVFQSATISIARNDVSSSQTPDQTRIIVIAKTGRVRACKPASSSDLTCSATSTD